MREVMIRTADEGDFAALDKLYYDFHQFHAHGAPDRLQDMGKIENQDWSQLHQALRAIFTNQDAVIFLAEVSGQIVALVEVYFRQENETNPLIVPHPHAYVQSVMVSETERRTGIGRKLMAAAREWARAKGATEMRLEVWEFNQGTMRFYEKTGFRTLKRTLVADI